MAQRLRNKTCCAVKGKKNKREQLLLESRIRRRRRRQKRSEAMGVLFNLLDDIEEKLGHSPHPAIVALPLGGWTVSAISDVLGLATGQRAYDDTARISLGIGLVGAAGAIVTGLQVYSYIPTDRPTHPIATTHAMGMVAATSLLATSFVLRERAHQAGSGPNWAVRALALSG
jgi:uncharacterized membrane protein